jgi:hypothetical protein
MDVKWNVVGISIGSQRALMSLVKSRHLKSYGDPSADPALPLSSNFATVHASQIQANLGELPLSPNQANRYLYPLTLQRR